jgi:hypothetical protein
MKIYEKTDFILSKHKFREKKLKLSTLSLLALLILSMFFVATTNEVQAEENASNPGDANYPIEVPSGVTPDETLETLPYISVRPNPVGLGQVFLVNLWLQPPLHVSRQFTDSFVVTITKPDGTEDTVGPMSSFQGDGTAWFEYIADQTGTWTLQFSFLGQFFPEGNYTTPSGGFGGSTIVNLGSAYYQPSESPKVNLTVQEDMIMSWPASSLPTDYWTRPISMENRDWWIIGGNCPYDGIGGIEGWPEETNIYRSNYKFTPYVTGPSTAHIVWRRQGALSGIFGGAYGVSSAFLDYSGGSFGGGSAGPSVGGNPSLVYNGRCYATVTKTAQVLINGTYCDQPTKVWQCYDIRTGEIYWEQTGIPNPPTIISYQSNSPAVPGAVFRTGATISLVSISSGRLIKYDPSTGAVTTNVSTSPISGGTVYCDPYVLSVQNLGGGNYRLINWTMEGTTSNFTARIQSNTTFPFSSLGTCDYEEMVSVTTTTISSTATGIGIAARITAVNLLNGAVLWNITTDTTSGTQAPYSSNTKIADHGKFAMRLNDGLWHAWDIRTGKVAWTTEQTSYPWGSFGAYAVQSAYGLLFYNQYDGVHAFDWETGELVWTFEAITTYDYETPYEGQYSWFSDGIVADGKLYTFTVEHSPTAPISRGFRIYCINATNGQCIWNETGAMIPGVVADGYLTASNYYDGYLYVFGKGQSETTITTQQSVISQGESVLLTGTVMDQSPGSPDTPCVSEESMTQWMEYLYMQHDMPSNITGVPVSIDAVDPTGKALHIATVTSDMSGTFKTLWTPDIPGEYTITATFMGDDSYGSSWAETAVGVTVAPETSSTSSPISFEPVSNTMMTIAIGLRIAIILAIAIVGMLILRKRP